MVRGSHDRLVCQTLKLSLDFLADGVYEMELFKDGANADRAARDYRKMTLGFEVVDGKVYSNSVLMSDGFLSADMAQGGGFVAKITKTPSF